MRRTPSTFLQPAIFEALSGLPVRVYDYVPEKTSFPYVTIGEEAETPWDTKTGPGSEVEHEIHLWSQKRGFEQNKTLTQRVLDAIFTAHEAGAFSSDKWRCVDMALVRIEHERLDAETRHSVVIFKFYLQEVII